MDNQDVRKHLLLKRMEAKAEIEKYRFLEEFTKGSYQKRVDELLDLIKTIDKALKELEK